MLKHEVVVNSDDNSVEPDDEATVIEIRSDVEASLRESSRKLRAWDR